MALVLSSLLVTASAAPGLRELMMGKGSNGKGSMKGKGGEMMMMQKHFLHVSHLEHTNL